MTEIQGQNGPLQADRDAAETPAVTAIVAIGVDLAPRKRARSDQAQSAPVARAETAGATRETLAANTPDAPVRPPSRSWTGRTGSTVPMRCALP
ncbi:MAG: hypothetical protein Pyrs2KO_29860 [Pyruvatibacter sp.]